MAPVILSLTDRGDGTTLAVVSLTPGRRARLIVSSAGVDPAQLRATILVLANRVERKGTR